MNYGSVCTGVGALDLAVEALFRAELAWHAEVDRDAIAVLARHWPGVPNLGDVRAITDAPAVDLICGGPPCQPVSQAGKRLGDADERFLWPAVLDLVGRLRPRWLVFENPPGISPWLPAILRRLGGLGYVGSYGVLSAAAVGAAHNRERYFILAALADSDGPAEWQYSRKPPGQEEPGRSKPSGGYGPASAGGPLPVADADSRRREKLGWPGRPRRPAEGWHDVDGRGAGDGVPADADGARRGRAHRWGQQCGPEDCPGAWADAARATGLHEFVVRLPSGELRDYRPALRRHAAVLGRPWPAFTIGRSLNGDFSEWMMMLPEGWLAGRSNGAKKRLAGNAVVPLQAYHALAQLAERLSPSLAQLAKVV